MASNPAIARALAALAANCGAEVGEQRLPVWAVGLHDVSDEQLRTATAHLLRTDTTGFLPPLARILNAVAGSALALPDCDALLKQVSGLGHQIPGYGWIYPTPETVRLRLGNAVGDAYIEAGASQCFADSAISREIATRTFRQVLHASAQQRGSAALLLATDTPLLSAGPPVAVLTDDD